jgi:hypothetical protein
MRELKVTQQSPLSYIVVQCHRCGVSWYIRPEATDEDVDSPRHQLMAAVDHECREVAG